MMTRAKSNRVAAGVLAAVLAVSAPAVAVAETLADALVSAYNNSGLLDQNRALLRAADEDVAVSVSSLRPILNWSADVTRSWSRRKSGPLYIPTTSVGTDAAIGISAELLLYDFGQTRLGIDIAKESVLGARQALLSVEQGVLQRAVGAYMEVRRQSEFLALRQNNVRLITEELRAARDRFEVGEVTRTDVALAEARLAAARGGLAVAQGNLLRAQEEYRTAVGHKPGRLAPPPRLPAIAKSVDAAKSVAMVSNPSLIRAQHEVTVSELQVLLAEAAMKPRITLNGQYGVSDSFTDPAYSRGGTIGIEAKGPLYQGGKLSALLRKSMAGRDSKRANLHIVQLDVSQGVGDAYAQLQAAQANRLASEGQVRAARVAFRGVREEATLGARTTLDVLNAEQESLDAQANLISSMADEQLAAYGVLAAMGQLTAERLNLGVQSYDPAAYYNMVKGAPSLVSKQGRKLDKVLRAMGKE